MVDGEVEDFYVPSGMVPAKCEHEIDETALPAWISSAGKVYRCIKCGASVVKDSRVVPGAKGKKIHRSKKERLRARREFERGD